MKHILSIDWIKREVEGEKSKKMKILVKIQENFQNNPSKANFTSKSLWFNNFTFPKFALKSRLSLPTFQKNEQIIFTFSKPHKKSFWIRFTYLFRLHRNNFSHFSTQHKIVTYSTREIANQHSYQLKIFHYVVKYSLNYWTECNLDYIYEVLLHFMKN